MIIQQHIEQVIDRQRTWLIKTRQGVAREAIDQIKPIDGFANIITGIRRCGKSTLLQQLIKQHTSNEIIYLNFEDIQLSSFTKEDFQRLYQAILSRGAHTLFFDEIQIVEGWEIFIHQLLREHYTIYITGSNASMLSIELGTHLTGRHLSTELFPFSYSEYLQFTHAKHSSQTFEKYLVDGGLPEYLATHEIRIIQSLLDDILIRDIAIRHGIRNVTPLRMLAVYLLTNIARPYTANRLTSIASNISTSTVIDYIDYLRDAYLIDTIGQYSTNLRTTQRNAKKVYCIDNGLSHSLSLSSSSDNGRLLENYYYMQLRRRHRNHIYYYQDSGECDFVVTAADNTPTELYQICYQLNSDNIDREIGGLRHAMQTLNIQEGTIITLSDEETLKVEEGTIHIQHPY